MGMYEKYILPDTDDPKMAVHGLRAIVDEYIQGLEDVGFEEVTVTAKTGEGELLDNIPEIGLFSASITARKPI